MLQQRNDDFNRPPYLRHLVATVTGANLFTTTGEEWQRRRRLLQPEFHRAHVAELIASMSAMVADALDRWTVPGTIDAQEEMSRLTLDVAERVIFGADAGQVGAELGSSFRAVVAWLTNRFYNPRAMPTFVPTTSNLEMRRARASLRSLVQTIVNERRAHPVERGDLLQLLLDARFESGGRLSDDEIVAECMSFLFAGHETTASTLAWASYELARHPAVTEVARAEVQRTCGDGPPQATDLGELTRIGRVAEETLRLHPPGWGIARTARRTSRLGDYRVPRGTGVIVSVYTINRSPRYWNDAGGFDPDRFLPGARRAPAELPAAGLRRRAPDVHRRDLRDHGDPTRARDAVAALRAQRTDRPRAGVLPGVLPAGARRVARRAPPPRLRLTPPRSRLGAI